jgi:hypothetical protein
MVFGNLFAEFGASFTDRWRYERGYARSCIATTNARRR